MHLRKTVLTIAAVLVAGLLASLGAWWSALAIERRSAAAVTSRLLSDGITWATVEANGLQVRLIGTAPNEAARFRVVNMAGSVVQASRVRDELDVTAMRAIAAPRFSLEILRNDDGISLIGLVPGKEVDVALLEKVSALTDAPVSDMLESADYAAPDGWDEALTFGLAALKLLPRSKISIAADLVEVTAISKSADEKRKWESDLARLAPTGLSLRMNITAPRPVLTPFTLRFVKDADGARFDACSADTEKSRSRIIRAGVAAGVTAKTTCIVGLGVPTPRWAEAAEAGIKAVSALSAGTVTFSDADVTLLGSVDTSQSDFDRVVGELQAQLPPVFSLEATLPPKPSATPAGPVEFTAALDEQGKVQLRGRLSDEVLRDAADSYARSQFGADRVYTATRLDDDLPDGWAIRVLAGLQSLAQLHHGMLLVRADTVELSGVTGKPDGRDQISRILSGQLGQGKTFRINVTYDEKFDPLAALPTPEECAASMNAVMKRQKITFAPGSAEIDATAGKIIDSLGEVLNTCPPLELEISGHTDSQGSEGGNLALSQARAEAVLTALQGRRLDVTSFIAKGYGEQTPIATNDTEQGREDNRRIEFKLLSKPEPVAEPSPVDLAEAAVAAAEADGTAIGVNDAMDPLAEADVTDAQIDAGTTVGGSGDGESGSGDGDPAAVDDTGADATPIADGDQEFIFEPSDEKWRRPKPNPQNLGTE
ncbi:OmpA family protein [Pseudorhodobacter sp.]|uniref:OmpA family protein n=1 Tax=Pseudorhodobacter sp. TaxID=1934400 RepID=UPI002647BF7D|nr:OmpA family protein [Pseudorhodobacter sp.]MDN5785687.1 OmpA family protein [Pseudorhodobacter sp.]